MWQPGRCARDHLHVGRRGRSHRGAIPAARRGSADQLGGYRISELIQALTALGVSAALSRRRRALARLRNGRYAPRRRHTRFIDAGVAAVEELVAVIDDFRPHVVVTYDPDGGYGHPDHIHVHVVTTAAVVASHWDVPKVYWTVMATSAVRAGLEALTDIPPGWCRPDLE